jgi:hypothetical protein
LNKNYSLNVVVSKEEKGSPLSGLHQKHSHWNQKDLSIEHSAVFSQVLGIFSKQQKKKCLSRVSMEIIRWM